MNNQPSIANNPQQVLYPFIVENIFLVSYIENNTQADSILGTLFDKGTNHIFYFSRMRTTYILQLHGSIRYKNQQIFLHN